MTTDLRAAIEALHAEECICPFDGSDPTCNLMGSDPSSAFAAQRALAAVLALLDAAPASGLDVARLASAAYADRPPLGRRPVPWTPVQRREWTAWAGRIAAALAPSEPEPEL